MQQHLLIDADDTLWENNIYFEQATHAFIEFLNHSLLSPSQVRAIINEIEREMGYGASNYTRSLQEVYRRLTNDKASAADLVRVGEFANIILHAPMEIIAGVPETLDYLRTRHVLMLLTKGDQAEQELKLERSGLRDYFQQVMVVAEKDVATYQRIVQELELDPATGWMIGNSPKSDINPAREVGLNTIFIPHEHTWQLEHQELETAGSGQFLTLTSFTQLRDHF